MKKIDWTNKGKTVAELIEELNTFENQDMEVRISLDDGNTSVPISLVIKKHNKFALLKNSESDPSVIDHRFFGS